MRSGQVRSADAHVNKVASESVDETDATRYDEYLLVLLLREPTLLSEIEFLTEDDFDQPDTRAVVCRDAFELWRVCCRF